MIEISPLKLAYQPVPKVASTTIFAWLNLIYPATQGKQDNEEISRRRFFYPTTDDISSCDADDYQVKEGYFRFILIRDPVKRFVSAYSHRVITNGELSAQNGGGRAAIALGLRETPDVDTFVANLEDYCLMAPVVAHHVAPISHFSGSQLNKFSHIINLSDIATVRDKLLVHWQALDLKHMTTNLPEFPRLQKMRAKMGIECLSQQSFNRLLDYYRRDYQMLPGLSIETIEKDFWKAKKSA